MAQPLTYADLERQKQEAGRQQQIADQSAQMAQQTAQERQAQANPVLAEYMNRRTQASGLGNPTANRLEYSEGLMNGVLQGRVDPAMVLKDEAVMPEYKQALAELMAQQTASAPTQAQGLMPR